MKNKKINILAVFVKIFYVIMIVLLFYIVGVLVQLDKSCDNQEDNIPKTKIIDLRDGVVFSSHFPECGLLDDKCLDSECDYYNLCSDRKYSVCEIYDCEEEFGIGTKDKDGKIEIRRKTKDAGKEIMEIKSRCAGSLEIIESEYINEKLETKVKVVTAGSCQIRSFWISCKDQEASKKIINKFSDLGDNLYSFSVDNCSEIVEIFASGENGISIK